MHDPTHERWHWIAGAALLWVPLMSCKGTDEPSTDGDGSSSSGADTTGTTVVADESSSSGPGATGGLDESSSGEPPPPTEVRIGGTIEDYFAMGPIVGAEISVLGLPELSTVSDDEGLWEFPDLPVQAFDRFVVAETDTYWGAVVPFQTELMDVDDFELSQVSLDVIDIQITALQLQEPTVMVEDDTAVFLVALNNNQATGAVVEIDPPPAPNTFYAPDPTGSPILNVNEIQWMIYPVAVFFNLPPGPEGTYEITVTHPERECTVDDPQPPTFGRHINLIRVDCPPPA
ncbi:hypothetical protein [Paraliomyxa miuraensis]|uniref:hypothetical protein n=1 Tax=Paraliomyxa miuraensis TaxID=376150 RepID=UPI0022536F0D|nr:hypothetical protein [Paraliomyxa miuraensis]MCX4242067.1 hypothetical protein [Paraliomyxa miuraensis]